MTKDFDKQLATFAVPETRDQTEIFFQKYWLNSAEYSEKWCPIQESIFDSTAKHLPDLMFNPNFKVLPLLGPKVFTSEADFDSMQTCMKLAGDEYFVVIQNENVVIRVYYGEHGDDDWRVHPPLRFRFPVRISWAEMMSGGYISIELFQGAAKDFFVFGDSGNWGRYVANDYANPNATPMFSTPLNIMGFKKEYSAAFRKNFEHLIQPEVISGWLPDAYKQLPGAVA